MYIIHIIIAWFTPIVSRTASSAMYFNSGRLYMKRRLNQITQIAVEHGLLKFFGNISKNIILTNRAQPSTTSVQLDPTDGLEVIFIIYLLNISIAMLVFIAEIFWHLIKKNLNKLK